MRSECGLKNERFGEFWGVVQRALKNIDFLKEVKGNLRAGSRAGGLGRAHGEAGWTAASGLEAGCMFLCSSVCLMMRK